MLLSLFETGDAPSSLSPKRKHWRTPLTIDCFSSTVPFPLPPLPYKICREPHNPLSHPFPTFLWVCLVQELTLARAQVATSTTPRHPELWSVRSPEISSSSLSIHDKLPCITATVRSNSDKLLPSHVHCESNASHSLQSLHPVHAISHTKINPNFRNIPKIYTNTLPIW
jgi:hypothetical protein